MRTQTLASDRFKFFQHERLDSISLSIARDGAGERVRGKSFDGAGDLGDFTLAAGREALHFFHTQFAGGERAGLVHRHHLSLREIFHRCAPAKQNAAPRSTRNGREHGGRNRKHERTR